MRKIKTREEMTPEERREAQRQRRIQYTYDILLPVENPLHSRHKEYKRERAELKSEKVRNIIGHTPSVLLRYGITIIGIALLTLVGVAAIIPYQPSIKTSIEVLQDKNGDLHFSALIPQNAINKQNTITDIVSDKATELSLPSRFKVASISDKVIVSEKDTWVRTTLTTQENISEKIQLEKTINIPGKILLEKKSFLNWVLNR